MDIISIIERYIELSIRRDNLDKTIQGEESRSGLRDC